MSNVHTEVFKVRAYETDPTGQAGPVSICNYLQEIAGNHALRLGVSIEQLGEQNLTWVLGRLVVEMTAYPAWRETARIETWPSGVDRLYASRDFFLYREPRTERIGRATTMWLLVDLTTRRPIRMPEAITSIKRPEREHALPHVFPRLQPPDTLETASESAVRYSEVDLNQHVNNVAYLTRMLDALPRAWLEAHTLRRLDLQFRAESVLGDTLRTEHAFTGEDTCYHRLLRPTDTREIATALTTWEKRGKG